MCGNYKEYNMCIMEYQKEKKERKKQKNILHLGILYSNYRKSKINKKILKEARGKNVPYI